MPTFVGARRKLRVTRDPSIVFDEKFDGGSLSRSTWPGLTDTGGNITVSGGKLVLAGGASNWTGTLLTGKPLTVVAGLTLDWDAIWSNLGSGGGGTIIGADVTTPIAVPLTPAFTQQNGVLTAQTTGGRTMPVTIALNTRYYWRLVYLNPGVLFYIATASNGPFSLLWHEPAGYTASQYPGYANYDGVFTCSNMRAYHGKAPGPIISVASPTMPTPTLGADAIVNGAFAADSDWTKGAGWAIGAGVGTATAASSDLSQTVAPLSANSWYQLIYTVTAFTAGTITPKFGTTAGVARGSAATFTETGLANSTAFAFTAAGLTASIDNVESKKLTTLFALVGDAGVKAGLFDCLISTLTVGTQAGIAVCLNSETSPTYYLHEYHDGTNYHLDKVENGAPTSLINTAQTWGATVRYRLDIVGTSIAAYADNTKIGNTQTVDTTSNYGTKVATFSTLATNAVTNVQVRGGM